MATSLPPNVHVSKHPCLRAKLSQFRSKNTAARESKTLVHEMANIIGCEALAAALQVAKSGTDESPLGYSYDVEVVSPARISLVPILRSGLGMVDAIEALLPSPSAVHHLGLFREPTTLQPVEYYNNLPYHKPYGQQGQSQTHEDHLAIILDPIIATGGTAVAAIQTLREWGVRRILVVSVLGSDQGVRQAAEEWAEGTEIWVGAVDGELNDGGMIKPGVGDVGDRLFLTKGK